MIRGWRAVTKIVTRKLDMIAYASVLDDFKVPPNNKLEKLKGSLSGFYSIRINDQCRIIFQLADHIGVDIKVINRIINERTGVSPIVAVKLGYAFRTSPEFWLNAQTALDVYNAKEELASPLKPIAIKIKVAI